MIKPSQRRNKRPSAKPAEDFKLHTQMARTRNWQQRLINASAVATAVSVALWLAGVPLLWHLLSVSLSFVVGLAYPVKGSAPWALRWIAARAGLSYQTALELDTSDLEDTGYGFSQALQQRARTTTNRLELPQNPRWWLPLSALAFGLALLPFTPFRDANRFAAVGVPTGLQGADVDTGVATDAEEPAANPEENQAAGPQSTETPRADENAPSVLDEFDDTNAEAPPEGVGNSQSEEQALSRFTENLSEREAPEQTNPFNSVSPEADPNTSQEPREGEPNAQAPAQGESEGEAQEGQGEQQAQQGEQGEQDPGAQDGSEGAQEQTPSADAQAEGEQQGEQESQGGQDGTATEASEQGAESEDQSALDEGGNDAAGQGATAPNTEPTTDLSQQEQAEPEFVEGQMGEGPSTLGGTTRLPGSTEGSAVPTGSPGSFNQAEEQAITEGRIPVEYQDIVRNYFR